MNRTLFKYYEEKERNNEILEDDCVTMEDESWDDNDFDEPYDLYTDDKTLEFFEEWESEDNNTIDGVNLYGLDG